MPAKNLHVSDLALIELARDGKTAASADVLDHLDRAGFVRLAGGAITLTAAGRERAGVLAPVELAVGGCCALGGSGFVYPEAGSIIGGTAGQAYTAKEG